MNNVYLSATINEDGSLTIPAFAVRGLGYEMGDEVVFVIPAAQRRCECADDELFLARCCDGGECAGYRSDGEALNIPAKLLYEAGIQPGGEISVLSANGALVIAAANDLQRDFTDEIGCFMEELGYDPETVETALPLPF